MARGSTPSRVFMVAGGAIFLVGLFALALAGWQYRLEARRQRSWQAVSGEVLGRSIQRREGRAGTSTRNITYEARYTVRYQVGGQPRVGEVGAGVGSTQRTLVERQAEQIAVGTSLLLKFDPENPAQLIFSDQQPGMAYSGPRSLAKWAGIVLGIGGLTCLLASALRRTAPAPQAQPR